MNLAREHLKLVLGDVVDTLPDKEREVLTALYWERVSEAEVARRLGCARSTIPHIVERAFVLIRELADHG